MAEIINLRQARKMKARDAADARAAANRAAFGRSKVEKQVAKDEAARIERTLDGARRDDASDS